MSNNANKMHRFNIIIYLRNYRQNGSVPRTSTGCCTPSDEEDDHDDDDEDMTSGNSNTANEAARMEISMSFSVK